jgi:hypothetical protein
VIITRGSWQLRPPLGSRLYLSLSLLWEYIPLCATDRRKTADPSSLRFHGWNQRERLYSVTFFDTDEVGVADYVEHPSPIPSDEAGIPPS